MKYTVNEVNKMSLVLKKIVSLYISPLLVITCYLIIWIIDIGAIILPIWLFKELCIPIIHFSIIN